MKRLNCNVVDIFIWFEVELIREREINKTVGSAISTSTIVKALSVSLREFVSISSLLNTITEKSM